MHRAPSSVTRVDDSSFPTEVLASPLPVLVDISTRWCPPCRAALPIINQLAVQHQGALRIVEIDGDESAELVASLGVLGFPTFLGFNDGKLVERQSGFSKRSLAQFADRLAGLSSSQAADEEPAR